MGNLDMNIDELGPEQLIEYVVELTQQEIKSKINESQH